MFLANTAFRELNRQYRTLMAKQSSIDNYIPIKDVKVIKTANGVPTITKTLMRGTTLTGYAVEKAIKIDDELGETSELEILYDTNGNLVDTHDNDGFTALRCGTMVCVALDEGCHMLGMKARNLKIGFIGNGKINIEVAKVINSVFGISFCVVHGSLKNRGKNQKKFPCAYVDCDCSLLNECDVIVSCTSGCDGRDMISTKMLPNPKLFIALDTGYLLDESFRKECDSYTDYVEQLDIYYKDEFIFDKDRVPLKQLCRDKEMSKDRLCIYLFGTGFADAVIAESMYKQRMKRCREAHDEAELFS